ncbi:glycoside hydrolase, partial [Clostridioides difficile]
VLTGLLREEMGFEGIIITDCLEMHAISKPYGVAEAAVRAVEAGADLILVSHTLQDQVAALEAIVEAVRTGRISEEVIHQAVERIMTWKKKRCGQQNDHLVSPKASETVEATDVEPVDCTKPTELREPNELTLFKIASSSITIVHNDGLLPLDPEKGVYVIWPEVVQRTEVDEP